MIDYSFLGQKRLTLIFDTPNQCGVALAMAGVFFASFALSAIRRRDTGRAARVGAVIAMLLLVPVFVGLALTYSRGGYLALAAGLAMTASMRRANRWPAAGLLTLFAGCVLLVPHGANRVAMMTPAGVDDSVFHRFALWLNALAMSWDFRWRGAGFGAFAEVYALWYQPASERPVFLTAVSDYVTIAAGGGLILFSGVVVLGAAVLAIGFTVARRREDDVLTAVVAALAAYATAGVWSTFILTPRVAIVPAVLLCALAALLIRHRSAFRETPIRRSMARSLVVSTSIVGIVWGAAFAVATGYKYIPHVHPSYSATTQSVELPMAAPRHSPPRGVVGVINKRWPSLLIARSIVRPLATAGYEVFVYQPDEFGAEGCQDGARFLARRFESFQSSKPRFLLGVGEGGRMATILGCINSPAVAGVAVVGARSWWPVADLSPMDTVTNMQSDLLIVHGGQDRVVDVAEARRLHARALDAGVQSALIEIPGADHQLREHWDEAMSAVIAFFDQQSANRP